MTAVSGGWTGAVTVAALLGLALVGGAQAAPTPAPPSPRPEPGAAAATPAAVARVHAAVVAIETRVPPDRPSAATLGEERAGSATVIEPDGLAVTVGYLVLEAARIDVTLDDGRRTTARVVGHDFESGLALIRLDPTGGPYVAARLGQSAGLAPGQPAAIVGIAAPGPMVGVMVRVTGVGPFVAYWEYLLDRAVFVAPHHPAFGGAALVDPDGALVGVVSLRLPAGHMAIPIDLLGPVREAMVRTGRPARPPRPWLGVRAVAIDGGVGIAGVSPTGPAHAAGLRPGDVILRVNGERVADVEAFYRRLWAEPVGQPLELGVWRDGALETVTVRPRDRYATFEHRSP
jgi:S1-C subfamily serine protease